MTTKMKAAEAAEAVEKITKSVPDHAVRVVDSIEVGDVVHQGDVYLHRVEDGHPRGERLGTRQVAVGSTVGARHVAEGEGVEVLEGKALPSWVRCAPDVPESAYLGPVVVAPRGLTLTHPEHAHHVLPSGTYQVTYQVDPVAQRRVRD